jgi:hypothetical protein
MRERSPLYSELEGLLLQSETKQGIEKSRDELEEEAIDLTITADVPITVALEDSRIGVVDAVHTPHLSPQQ